MPVGIRISVSQAPATRIGQLLLAGEVTDAETTTPRALRVLPGYVLSIVSIGHGSFRAATGASEPIGPGTVTLVHPGAAHWYGTPHGQRWTELFAVFTGPLFDALATTGVFPPTGPQFRGPTVPLAALQTLLRSSPRTQAGAERQLHALAGWLLDLYRPDDDDKSDPAIIDATRVLTDDITGSLDMPSVAAAVGVPYDTFRRRFLHQTGQTPLAYRNRVRIEAAATLLRATDLTTRAIARTLGYTDEFHFSRQFHKHFGVAPSCYRTQEADEVGHSRTR